MFACRNLNLSYKGNKILKDIHFHIPEGTVFCITGESGSGKSSLLKVINGIIPEITEAEISGEIKLNTKILLPIRLITSGLNDLFISFITVDLILL